MKLGWGTRIALLYIGFVAMIAILVWNSMQQDFHLVSKDYYQKELAFQDVIEAGANQSTLSRPVEIIKSDSHITFSFPPEFSGKSIKGDIYLYSPVNDLWDRSYPIAGDGIVFSIPANNIEKTRYQVKINWEAGGKKYFQESELSMFN
jgi:hypothetical protein